MASSVRDRGPNDRRPDSSKSAVALRQTAMNATSETEKVPKQVEAVAEEARIKRLIKMVQAIDEPRRRTGLRIEDPSKGKMPTMKSVMMFNTQTNGGKWFSWVPLDQASSAGIEDIPSDEQQAERWTRCGRPPTSKRRRTSHSTTPLPGPSRLPQPAVSEAPAAPEHQTLSIDHQALLHPQDTGRISGADDAPNTVVVPPGTNASTPETELEFHADRIDLVSRSSLSDSFGVSQFESQFDEKELEDVEAFLFAEHLANPR